MIRIVYRQLFKSPSSFNPFRHEFDSEQIPDLTRDVFRQDIHSVGSLCKLYFRELPNPLLTYQLYDRFSVGTGAAELGQRIMSRIKMEISVAFCHCVQTGKKRNFCTALIPFSNHATNWVIALFRAHWQQQQGRRTLKANGGRNESKLGCCSECKRVKKTKLC